MSVGPDSVLRRCRRTTLALSAAILACGITSGALAADPATTAPAKAAAPAPAKVAAPAKADAPGVSARDDAVVKDTEPLSSIQPFPVASTPATAADAQTPLMSLFDKAGIGKGLEDARIRIYGHAEASYTYNLDQPFKDINAGRVFDIENEAIRLNQLTLNVERTVAINKNQFDLGGRIEFLYGSDARFIHANGLFDHHDNDPTGGVAGGPVNQFDLVQAYADINLPVGNGLRLRVGKFTYFKQIDPNNSVFYSHSYTFGAALPFTLTGIYGTYQINDKLTVDAGISRGWDQALEDNNGAIDFFGRVKYTVSDKTTVAAAFITGPEQDGDNGNYRTAVDVTVSHQVNDNLVLLFDAVYGQQAGGSFATIVPGTLGGAGIIPGDSGTSHWYGLSAYAIQRINDQFSLGARVEVYRDDGGYTTSLTQTLWEATLGVIITPFPNDPVGQNLKIRPEIRYDYSTEKFFSGFTDYDQWTLGVDVVFNF